MTTTKQEVISKAVFDQLETLLDAATEQGDEAVAEHFKALAYALGAHVAVKGKPDHMPDFINAVLENFGQGIKVGMQIAHGLNGHMCVQVHSVTRSKA
ncbi:hypothetical protein [Paenibacillus sp. IHBB 10380]|uniref:hypothetical protein n=1 Tax=Paenibacillus sp. IHBB 10380 TaxID=1566358 RepID=UPI0005CFD6F3|nr:hypothetical protein [Paenibacillus sp. IHBB 10380]AJS59231.1 hypothetical protein UB51_13005 [Paenibacillus sp. IHBB 10380]